MRHLADLIKDDITIFLTGLQVQELDHSPSDI